MLVFRIVASIIIIIIVVIMSVMILSICLLGYHSLKDTSLGKWFPKSAGSVETLAGSQKPRGGRLHRGPHLPSHGCSVSAVLPGCFCCAGCLRSLSSTPQLELSKESWLAAISTETAGFGQPASRRQEAGRAPKTADFLLILTVPSVPRAELSRGNSIV